jgi:hypothetical protein
MIIWSSNHRNSKWRFAFDYNVLTPQKKESFWQTDSEWFVLLKFGVKKRFHCIQLSNIITRHIKSTYQPLDISIPITITDETHMVYWKPVIAPVRFGIGWEKYPKCRLLILMLLNLIHMGMERIRNVWVILLWFYSINQIFKTVFFL